MLQQLSNSSIIGTRVFNNIKFLKSLSRSKSDSRRWKIIKKANNDELLALVEICSNILRPGCFCISNRQIRRLQQFAPIVRAISRKRSEKSAKRCIINQYGNGPLFVALLSPIIAEVARAIIEKVSRYLRFIFKIIFMLFYSNTV